MKKEMEIRATPEEFGKILQQLGEYFIIDVEFDTEEEGINENGESL